jgi:hypothetical protein
VLNYFLFAKLKVFCFCVARKSILLNADRFWVQPDELDGDASGLCVASGVRANIWAHALRRAEITHNIRGGGRIGLGWGVLKWQENINTDVVRFGRHAQLKYLGKKVANFLH